MAGSYLLIWGFFAIFGIPLICVGTILRLTEWSWKKQRGSNGSTKLLVAGILLVMPVILYFVISYMS